MRIALLSMTYLRESSSLLVIAETKFVKIDTKVSLDFKIVPIFLLSSNLYAKQGRFVSVKRNTMNHSSERSSTMYCFSLWMIVTLTTIRVKRKVNSCILLKKNVEILWMSQQSLLIQCYMAHEFKHTSRRTHTYSTVSIYFI